MKESQKKALIQVLLCIRNTAVGLLGIIGWLLHTLLAVLTVGLLSAALVCILIYAKVKPQLDECRELAYDKLAQMETTRTAGRWDSSMPGTTSMWTFPISA